MLCKHKNHGECEECTLEAEDGEREEALTEAKRLIARDKAVRFQLIALQIRSSDLERATYAQRLAHLLCTKHKLSYRDVYTDAVTKRREN